jgi:hypothetical protein
MRSAASILSEQGGRRTPCAAKVLVGCNAVLGVAVTEKKGRAESALAIASEHHESGLRFRRSKRSVTCRGLFVPV